MASGIAFNALLGTELLRLQEELRSFTDRPGPYRQFRIRDPKPRRISAVPYRDRVVHHALCTSDCLHPCPTRKGYLDNGPA
jgi:hypothetical protein